jgi:hypothetical protein
VTGDQLLSYLTWAVFMSLSGLAARSAIQQPRWANPDLVFFIAPPRPLWLTLGQLTYFVGLQLFAAVALGRGAWRAVGVARWARGQASLSRPQCQRPRLRRDGSAPFICRAIADQHDGQISVTSWLGQRSTFKLALPLMQEEEQYVDAKADDLGRG